MITVLGATGNVGGKIADNLIKRGEQVCLVARSANRLRPHVGKQATAMAGDALDTEFLVKAMKGSDAVFTLIPPNIKADSYMSYADRMIESIARALEISGVSHVVNLSSIGGDAREGTGSIVALHKMEERLNRIKNLNVVHIRAGFFMENLLMNMDVIKTKGLNSSPYRGDMKFPMIATKDVAAYATDRLLKKDFKGSSVQYLLGNRDMSMTEITTIIGKKIGKPELSYIMVSYDEARKAFVANGFSQDISRLYIEMSKAFNEGRITVEERSSKNTTPTSFEEFCDQVFVPIYRERKAA